MHFMQMKPLLISACYANERVRYANEVLNMQMRGLITDTNGLIMQMRGSETYRNGLDMQMMG